ncbi:MAG: cupin domain-containing protein [Desulfobacterales bacterium]|nr:cupin domain-containing protein [Desulfobacterales bacterium]
MSYGDKKNAMMRNMEADYYQERLREVSRRQEKLGDLKTVVCAEDMPWEVCPQGTLKHLVNEKMNTRANTVDLCMQIVPAGGRSGKHRHMAEEYMFILEGKGYSLHWDVDFDLDEAYAWTAQDTPSRWEWEKGDSVYIPPNTIHQHFNAEPDNPARFLSAESRMFKFMGLDDLEQLENAPEFEEKKGEKP